MSSPRTPLLFRFPLEQQCVRVDEADVEKCEVAHYNKNRKGLTIMKKISPTNDLAFKKTLASEENKDILQGLITDFYEIEVENLAIEHPYSISDYKEILDGKEVVLLRQTIKDVSASFKVADFIAEMQVRMSAFFDERAMYYTFDRFCKNFNRADKMLIDSQGKLNRYSSLRPVYSLNILNYTHFTENDVQDYKDALHVFELYDIKRQKHYKKDLLKVGFFELTKTQGLTTNQRHWLDYFTTGVVDDSAPDYIKKASQVIEFANLAEEEKIVVEALEKAEAIRIAENHQSFLDGQDKRTVEIARNMMQNNEPLEKIKIYTGLSADYIESL